MEMTEQTCRSCAHVIDGAAKLCPFCGADPATGEKTDVAPLIQEHFPPKPRLSPLQRALLLLRARQGIVLAVAAGVVVLLFVGLHQWASSRNAAMQSEVPAVPLTEITDLSRQSQGSAELPLPDLPFAYDGNARTLQTFLVEPGAVNPAAPPAAAGQPPVAGQPPKPGVAAPAVAPTRPAVMPPQTARPR